MAINPLSIARGGQRSPLAPRLASPRLELRLIEIALKNCVNYCLELTSPEGNEVGHFFPTKFLSNISPFGRFAPLFLRLGTTAFRIGISVIK